VLEAVGIQHVALLGGVEAGLCAMYAATHSRPGDGPCAGERGRVGRDRPRLGAASADG
jgi:hypothetical protein